ncbi:hypothetical protein [Gryllotalpicola protaetiae]|uniref:PDGLE domain-containing protein n=1 Tax=Gryllotalpicola protaetiae TaxID=2419771 RepID=A0A387BXB6_9MICO|nr:hypothetical protein [Gryllotalpicola protaetiae]AYG02991.1 hypothetical protein D7I44_05260 [Gryllotalpicola protaetiae]
MTETQTMTRRSGRGIRRAIAALAAVGLAFTAMIAAAPAFAAPAAAAPVAVVAELDAGYQQAMPIAEEIMPINEEIVPISEDVAITPIAEVYETLTRPLGLTVFVVSALALGAGGIAIARVTAQRKHAAPERSES